MKLNSLYSMVFSALFQNTVGVGLPDTEQFSLTESPLGTLTTLALRCTVGGSET